MSDKWRTRLGALLLVAGQGGGTLALLHALPLGGWPLALTFVVVVAVILAGVLLIR